MTTDRRAAFADALTGADGMADPAPPPWDTEFFADALAAPAGDATPRITLPEIPVPPATRQAVARQVEQVAAQVPPPVAAHWEQPPAPVEWAGVLPAGTPLQMAPPPGSAPPIRGSSYPSAPQRRARADTSPARVAARQPPRRPRPAPGQVRAPQRAAAPRTPATRPAARPAARPAKKGSAGGAIFTILFVIVLLLISSGAGREILDVITDFLNQ